MLIQKKSVEIVGIQSFVLVSECKNQPRHHRGCICQSGVMIKDRDLLKYVVVVDQIKMT